VLSSRLAKTLDRCNIASGLVTVQSLSRARQQAPKLRDSLTVAARIERLPRLRLRLMNLVLIGLRGAGKTTVGQLLAERTGWPFLDTDVLIQGRSGETIKEIFTRGGEVLFRKLEAEAVRECAARDRVVIACGGGAVLDPRNVRALQANGFVVHLTAEAEELWRRVAMDSRSAETRPVLLAAAKSGLDELRELARARAAAYAQARHVEVPAGGRTPAEVAAAVLALFETRRCAKEER